MRGIVVVAVAGVVGCAGGPQGGIADSDGATGSTTSSGGEVVEFVRSVYRGDRYRLVTELRPALR